MVPRSEVLRIYRRLFPVTVVRLKPVPATAHPRASLELCYIECHRKLTNGKPRTYQIHTYTNLN